MITTMISKAFIYIYNNLKLFIALAVVLGATLYSNELKLYYNSLVNEQTHKEGIYTINKLAQFDGVSKKPLYLAVLGVVFDVTEGARHYKKGAPYNYFIGKDGSRALVTGNFKDEGNEKDHVLDLNCNDLFTLFKWRTTFREKYTEVGVLVGRFFDHNGEETAYAKEFQNRIKQCEVEKENSRKEDEKFPPCNVAWSADEGTKVWCTTSSGGIKRSWTGVPRQLYTPGVEKPRCVCINSLEPVSVGLIKEYNNCPVTSTECVINT